MNENFEHVDFEFKIFQISFPDFIFYEMLDQHLIMLPTCLDNTSNLSEYHKRFQEIPQIKNYMMSNRFMKAPLNSRYAKFGNV